MLKDSGNRHLKFGKYEILEELGRGGFGTVYKAEDQVLGRLVAIKILHPALVVETNFIERFRQEARTAAMLDHPNLVPVYDFGETEGRYYIAMGYMPGGSLKDLLKREEKLEPERAYQVLSQVCDGLEYAHARGIIHRDLKPGNILFDETGKARVADMGFAKVMSEGASRSMSASGSLVGTPAYMAPEVWRNKPATSQTDIYSLGCILYEMLTGKVLFEGESPAEIMTMHMIDGPQYAKDLLQELRPVLDKALQREPKERFVDVKALLTGFRFAVEPPQMDTVIHPIFVEPEPPITPKANVSDESKPDDKGASVKKIGKSKLAIGIIGAAVVLFLISICFWVALFYRPPNKANLPNATATNPPVVTNTKISLVQQFSTTTPTTQPTPNVTLTQLGISGTSVITNANADQVEQLARLGKGNLNKIEYSPDGSLIAVASSIGIYLYDSQSLEEVSYFGENINCHSVAWSPDGKTLASIGHYGPIILWDADSGTQLRTLEGHENWVDFVTWSPDGKTLASGGYQSIILWSTVSGTKLRTLDGHSDYVLSVAWSPDSTMLASAGDDKKIILWSADSGTELRTLEGHLDRVDTIAWSPNGKMLASGSVDKSVILWDVETGVKLHSLVENKGYISQVLFSSDSQILASLSYNYSAIILWDVESGTQLHKLEDDVFSTQSITWSPDGQTLASGKDYGSITLWDITSGAKLRKLEGDSGWVGSVSWSPDGNRLGSGGLDGTVSIWAAESWKQLFKLDEGLCSVVDVTWLPEGNLLASVEGCGGITVWDAQSGMRQLTQKVDDYSPESVSWSPDGKNLAMGGYEGLIILWDVDSGTKLRTLEGHTDWVNSLAWSPDGKSLVSGSDDGTLILWSAESGTKSRTLEGHTEGIGSVAWSPDGKRLASASDDGTVILWSAESGTKLRTLEGHSSGVQSVAWSPDGTILASGSWDDTIILWSADSGTTLRTLKGHSDWIRNVAWSPDGKTLASGSDDGTIRLWGIP